MNQLMTYSVNFVRIYLYVRRGGRMMKEKILVVDDEPEIADLVELYLLNENYEVAKFYKACDAIEYIKENIPDLAILDLMLPEIDGFTICKKIREMYNFPIIMLTARDGEMDKITGLTLGADDYITKPFRPLELIARVKSQLRRFKKYNVSAEPIDKQKEYDNILFNSNIEMNIKTHECKLNDRFLTLTPTEFEILRILLERKGEVVSAEELFHGIWKDEYYTKSNNTITVHIRHLREKMQDAVNEPKYIKTVWGVGYKIDE